MKSRKVPAISQRTMNLCWEACARMMWSWRHGGLKGYAEKAGRDAKLDAGKTLLQMDTFYRKLGMLSFKHSTAGLGGIGSRFPGYDIDGMFHANLRHKLNSSPMIMTLVGKEQGHAMVCNGYTAKGYEIVDPCGVATLDFDVGSESCAVANTSIDTKRVTAEAGAFYWYWVPKK